MIFPAPEAGQLSFAQAAELRRAPAHARRNLLDRTIRERVPFSTVRTWVQETRHMERQARAGIGASLAAQGSGAQAVASPPPDGPYSAALAHLQALGAPASAADRGVVRQIIQLCSQWLEPQTADPRGNGLEKTPDVARAKGRGRPRQL